MTDSENEKQKLHLRCLMHNGMRLWERYPQVDRIEIHYVREHNSFVAPNKDEGSWKITPQSEMFFVIDCLNRECSTIGFDLGNIICSAIRNNETEISGEMKCEGQEAPDHPEQSCDGKLKYTIKVYYKK